MLNPDWLEWKKQCDEADARCDGHPCDEPIKFVDPAYAELRKAQIKAATEKAAREHDEWFDSLSDKERLSLPGTHVSFRTSPLIYDSFTGSRLTLEQYNRRYPNGH